MSADYARHSNAKDFKLNISIFCASPLTLFCSAIEIDYVVRGFEDDIHGVSVFAAIAAEMQVPCHFCLKLSWSAIATNDRWANYADHIKRFESSYPGSVVTIFANTIEEMEFLKTLSLPCEFINHNCFIDDSVFTIFPAGTKCYDAVYIGKLHNLKRHFLAKQVESLLLIYSPWGENEANYFDQLLQLLPRAKFLNGDFSKRHPELGPYRYLSSLEVAQALNTAKVGLCLSAIEGAMNASTEYMLCGLPVVSTASLGGRDVFFEEDYCLVVDESPSAVAQAVNALTRRQLDPLEIRRRTLSKLDKHRARVKAFLGSRQASVGAKITFDSDMQRLRPFWGCLKHQSIQELGEEYRRLKKD